MNTQLPITIGIDGNDANVLQKVGVSVYCFELINYFSTIADENVKFIIYLRAEPDADLPKSSPYFTYQVVKAPLLWSKAFLPFHLFFNKKPDVFFSHAHYIP
ncbi:MAG: hypothetical protein ACMG6E_05950, partial [Candidatus Roizmanbacteria bacterium]